MAAVAELPPPSTVEEPRAILGMTGYLRQFVEQYNILAVSLTDILGDKAFATKRAAAWCEQRQNAFITLKTALT